MPVYKDKQRNTWYVVINKKDPISGKNKAQFKRGFATKREAVTYEKQKLLEGTYEHTSSTFREIFELKIKNDDLAKTTVITKRGLLEKYFSQYMDTPIEKITRHNIMTWRASLAGKDIKTVQKNNIISTVKSVFNFAEKHFDIQNAARSLDKFKRTSDDIREMSVWTPEEFEQFIEHVNHPIYKPYFTLLFWTGCRRSEGAALCKDDIDLENRTISINKGFSSMTLEFTALKNMSSKRVISVDSVTLESLKPLIEKADPYIFGGDHVVITSYASRLFERAIKKSGVKRIRIHDLRHSHASWLINNGVNIVAVSKRLGHSSINQTLSTYTHLLESTNNEMIEKIESYRKAEKV